MEASYGGLFKASGGFSKENGNKHLTEKGKNLEISFMVRKVLISRPWLEIGLLKYPTIGIKSLKAGTWSSGDLDPRKNKGQFPLLPTAMVVAKDINIHAESFDSDMEDTFAKMKTNASLSVVGETIIMHSCYWYFFLSAYCPKETAKSTNPVLKFNNYTWC